MAVAVEKEFPSLNEAVDENFSKLLYAEKKESKQESAKDKKLERNLKNQLASIDDFKKKDAGSKETAEAIYANYSAINTALQLAKSFSEGKSTKEEIMYKLSGLGLKLKNIDLKNKKMVVELPS